MNLKILLPLVLFASVNGYAQSQAWVSDQLITTVNDSPSRSGKFVGTVTSGEAVEITGAERDGYLPIRTEQLQGWVLAKNIMTTPSVHAEVAEKNRQIASLQQQNRDIVSRESHLSSSVEDMHTQISRAQAEAEQAKAELVELRRVSGNAIAIGDRNKALQSEIVTLEQRIIEQTHDIHRLQQAANKQQWLVGGGLVVAGFILQWLFSVMRLRRSRERYDSFDL